MNIIIFILVFIIIITIFGFYFMNRDNKYDIFLLARTLSACCLIIGVSYTYYKHIQYINSINIQNDRELSKKWNHITDLYMKYSDELEFLYYDINKRLGYPKPLGKRTKKNIKYEYHAVSKILSYLSDIFFTYDLMLPDKYNNPENIDSVNIIKKHISSDIFYNYWNDQKGNYDALFIKFMEKIKKSLTEQGL